jgi:hypothetical protein
MTDDSAWPGCDLPGGDLPGHDLPEGDHPHDDLLHDHFGPDRAEALAPADGDPFTDESDGWAPYAGVPDAAEPESLADTIYGPSGVDGVAHDLWSQLQPGVPVPTGLDGAPLAGADLLDELRERVHDPMLANVIDSVLAELRA